MAPGRGWLFVLITIFSIGILWQTFNLVFGAYLLPEFKDIVNDDSLGVPIPDEDKIIIINAYDNYMKYYKLMPFILIFLAILYFLILAFKRERESELTGGDIAYSNRRE